MKTEGQARFDGRAARYDRSPHQATFFKPLHELALREACRETPRPRAVLDLGCGTGQFLQRAAAAFPGAELVGVDESAAMVDRARASAPSDANMRFLHARAEALPLADSSFDLAVTTASFHHWADQSRGLAEVCRVLRPGGTLLLGDVLAAGLLRFGPLAWLLSRLDAGRFSRPEVLDGMLREAGFRVIRRTAVPRWAKVVQVTVACRR